MRPDTFVIRQFSLSDYESLVCEMRVLVRNAEVCVVLRDAPGTPFQGVLACRFEQVASLVALELLIKRVPHEHLRFFHERRLPGLERGPYAQLHEVTMTRAQGWYWQGRWTPISARTLYTLPGG